MNPANATNGPDSARTSNSGPSGNDPRREASASSKPDAPAESDYLHQQADAARAAIAGAFSELKSDLAAGADPRVWMKSHPWITLASVAVAGFAAAAAVVPSKDEQALRKLAAIERALDSAHEPKPSGNGAKPAHEGGFVATLIHELIGAIKPLVLTLLASHLNPQRPGDAPGSETNTSSTGNRA